MAETRTINLEIKDNFKKVEKDIDDLNESLKDTAENNRDVSKTFEEVYGELKPLTARMGEAEDRLYELAAAGAYGFARIQGLITNRWRISSSSN
jgi:septal ring factor EnvC (AmiA/AmiB activator)